MNGVLFFKDLRLLLDKKSIEASEEGLENIIFPDFFSMIQTSYDSNWWFCVTLQLVLVNPIGEVMEKLQRADEAQDLARPDSLFLTVGEAVASLSSTMKCQSSNYV